ncbi:unnamed protein product [Prunus brigantina]
MEVGEARQASRCYCGKVARTITFWTDSNPRRRFQVCPLSKGRVNKGYVDFGSGLMMKCVIVPRW